MTATGWMRKHVGPRGRPKRLFLTREEAEAERDKRCPAKDIYRCDIGAAGEHWHIGGRR